MDSYELFLFVHVLAAVVWVGGGVMIQTLAVRVLRTSDPRRITSFAADVEWVANRIFIPASLVLIVAAVALMIDGDYAWSALWVSLSLAAYIASAVTGAAFLGPESGRISKIVAAEGPESPEAVARIKRILVGSRIELIVLIAVVYLMTVKPTAADTGALILLVAGVAILAVLLLRGAVRGAAAGERAVTE